jgi:glutathione S-transferase
LKLYHSSGSPNSRRVRILIAEKDLDIELAPVDLGAKEEFSDAYRAINPRAVVPTHVLDNGTAIGEVPAIMRYLDEAYPKVPLLGATPKEKALITMWERRAELEGFALRRRAFDIYREMQRMRRTRLRRIRDQLSFALRSVLAHKSRTARENPHDCPNPPTGLLS